MPHEQRSAILLLYFRKGPDTNLDVSVLVRTIYYTFKSAKLFGSFTGRILLIYLERSQKDCLCFCTFLGVLPFIFLTFANSVNLPFY